MRRGFGLITAIIFLVLIGTIGVMSLSLSSISSKQVSDVYLREQAELLVYSAIEYAMLAFTAHDRGADGNCLKQVTTYYPTNDKETRIFESTATFKYFVKDTTDTTGCPDNIASSSITTDESEWSFILDVEVKTSEVIDKTNEPIRLFRRTLQKP